jgi:hypothetical protein
VQIYQDHPVVCNICLLEGHTRNDCPDIYLPPLLDLPPMHSKFLRELDSVCKQEMGTYWFFSNSELALLTYSFDRKLVAF